MATIHKRAADERSGHRTVTSSRRGEFFSLLAASAVVVLGMFLVYQAKRVGSGGASFSEVEEKLKTGELINLNKIGGPSDLLPALSAFGGEADKQFAAGKISDHIARNRRRLDSVAGLVVITVERSEIISRPELETLRARLHQASEDEKAAAPEKSEPPFRLLADVSQFKQQFVVRSPVEFEAEFLFWCALSILIFYAIHFLWRWRGYEGDALLLPVVHLLTGIGLVLMTTLRDPLRDKLAFKDFAIGVIAGGAVLYAASLIDYQRFSSRLVWRPLAAAIGLSSLLLVFGKGPGASDAKVNLWGFQPVEFIKFFLVFFLAGYFAENWECLRELKQKGRGLLALLRRLGAPRLAEIGPVAFATAAALAFFFLQKDLGPALIMGLTFLALYALARNRYKAALAGLAILVAGVWIAYETATPLLVYQRIRIWLDLWDNGLRNGDQIAHAWWALASGGLAGTGLGLGDPSVIPAGHTDLILAAAGEELGLTGLATILILYATLTARCLRTALQAQSDYAFFLTLGLTLSISFEVILIAGGVFGLFPLSGVASPFLSYGKSSMIASCAIVGVVLSVSARGRPEKEGRHCEGFGLTLKIISSALCALAVLLISKAAYIQTWKANENIIAPVLTKQQDDHYRYVYNPRLAETMRHLPRGSVYDRNGVPLATSDWAELEKYRRVYDSLDVNIDAACRKDDKRYYPFGSALFHFLGDARTKENWGAKNSAYVERAYAQRLRGFDDRAETVRKTVFEVDQQTKQVTPREVEVLRRDYSELLPLLRARHRRGYQELVGRERDVWTSIDVRLQLKVAEAMRLQLVKQNLWKGAAVVLDSATGEVLAMVSYPLPPEMGGPAEPAKSGAAGESDGRRDQFLNRALYGLYPPGSTFKIVTAIAALRKNPGLAVTRHECKVLNDERVGNYIKGWRRPVRDAEEERAHGEITMEEGIVHSCNAFFGQLAAYDLGAVDLWQTVKLLEINMAKPDTAQALDASLPWSAFGQGQVLASPFQMARVAATVANGGVMPYGRWVIDDSNQRTLGLRTILGARESAVVSRAMRGAVERGTAIGLKAVEPPISGKTGTAEVEGKRPHSWFIGFAPIGDQCKVAFAVVIENGGFGSASAALVAGEIVKAMKEY